MVAFTCPNGIIQYAGFSHWVSIFMCVSVFNGTAARSYAFKTACAQKLWVLNGPVVETIKSGIVESTKFLVVVI